MFLARWRMGKQGYSVGARADSLRDSANGSRMRD